MSKCLSILTFDKHRSKDCVGNVFRGLVFNAPISTKALKRCVNLLSELLSLSRRTVLLIFGSCVRREDCIRIGRWSIDFNMSLGYCYGLPFDRFLSTLLV